MIMELTRIQKQFIETTAYSFDIDYVLVYDAYYTHVYNKKSDYESFYNELENILNK